MCASLADCLSTESCTHWVSWCARPVASSQLPMPLGSLRGFCGLRLCQQSVAGLPSASHVPCAPAWSCVLRSKHASLQHQHHAQPSCWLSDDQNDQLWTPIPQPWCTDDLQYGHCHRHRKGVGVRGWQQCGSGRGGEVLSRCDVPSSQRARSVAHTNFQCARVCQVQRALACVSDSTASG